MTNAEKEVWKIYPEYPFVEANQYGEVRTRDRIVMRKDGSKYRVKGRILKQRDNGHGYMIVKFSVNGKTISLYVHRICATCFIPNPQNLPEVNHKDNNPKNNSASNLEWCTHQYNMAYKETYGTSAEEALGRPVFAVNLETFKVLHFKTQAEAARQLGICDGHINTVVKGKLQQAGGYLFVENESEITKEKIQEIRNNMYFLGGVIAVNLETLKVFRFKSQREAERQLGIANQGINHVLKGKQNKTHNYWLCYANSTAIEKTREKFGDDVADEVEKLMNNKQ